MSTFFFYYNHDVHSFYKLDWIDSNHKNNYSMHEYEKNLNLHINKIFEIEILELFFENFTIIIR